MKALILYENMRYEAKATATLRGAARRAGVEMDWDIHYWRSDLLTGPAAASEAQADATDAALVLLASNDAHLPPVWLMVWLEKWATNRQIVDSALAVIGDDGINGQSASGFPRLYEFARRHGLALIVRDNTKNQVVSDFFARRFRGAPPVLLRARSDWTETSLHAARREWGINE